MKTKRIPIFALSTRLLLFASALNVQAVYVIKLDSTTIAAATGWSAVPAATDIGEFDGTLEGVPSQSV